VKVEGLVKVLIKSGVDTNLASALSLEQVWSGFKFEYISYFLFSEFGPVIERSVLDTPSLTIHFHAISRPPTTSHHLSYLWCPHEARFDFISFASSFSTLQYPCFSFVHFCSARNGSASSQYQQFFLTVHCFFYWSNICILSIVLHTRPFLRHEMPSYCICPRIRG
jgi:hypothetical protein